MSAYGLELTTHARLYKPVTGAPEQRVLRARACAALNAKKTQHDTRAFASVLSHWVGGKEKERRSKGKGKGEKGKGESKERKGEGRERKGNE